MRNAFSTYKQYAAVAVRSGVLLNAASAPTTHRRRHQRVRLDIFFSMRATEALIFGAATSRYRASAREVECRHERAELQAVALRLLQTRFYRRASQPAIKSPSPSECPGRRARVMTMIAMFARGPGGALQHCLRQFERSRRVSEREDCPFVVVVMR